MEIKGTTMNILVTGGAGFIGSHITDALLAAGHDVTIIDNLSTGSILNVPREAEFIEIDICDPDLYKIFKTQISLYTEKIKEISRT